MSDTVIGIDPDAKAHGVAVYEGDKLMRLAQLDAWGVTALSDNKTTFVIEDVMANKFLYSRYHNKSYRVRLNIAMSVGRCQQAQVELERLLERRGQAVKKIPPTRGNWANDEKAFKRQTGWAGRSNCETRSAAFMGWLHIKTKGER